MEIIVTHLTRMAHGYICAAGNDTETLQDIRPVLSGQARIPAGMTAENGGPFIVGGIVNIGKVVPAPRPPETEDHRFFATVTKRTGTIAPDALWQLLDARAETSLTGIFGPELTYTGRTCSLTEGSGTRSLGFLAPAHINELYIRQRPGGASVRIKVSDGAFNCDLSVTDLRLYREDNTGAWAPRHELYLRLRNHLLQGREMPILAVGLTRAFSPDGDVPRHWLQVNNIHVQDPTIFGA